MFGKYGEDRTGRMPVDLFVTAVLESRNRIIAMVGRCSLPLSKAVLKAPMVSALESRI